MTPPRSLLGLVLAAGTLAAVLAGPAQARKSYDCPKRAGTLAVKPLGRVWHQAGSLYGCTTVYGRRPVLRRLGPWKPGTRVVFDGVDVVWTVPLVRAGARSDRVWAASAQDGRRWLSGHRLLRSTEARLGRLLGADQGAGWVTTDGAVVLALRSPQSAPEAVGTLPAPPQADGGLVVLGPFAAADPAALAASATLEELEGDGDECGGVNPYRLTVRPDSAGERVGVTWWGGWERPFCG
jgi:hypothetical protein